MPWGLAAWDKLRIHPTPVPKAVRALPPALAAVFISLRMDPRDSRGSPGSGVTAMQRKSLPGSDGHPEGKRPAAPRSHGAGSGAGAREECWHAGRAARGVTACSRLPAPVRCFGGGFSTRRCLGGSITACMAQVLGLLPWVGGAPEVTKPGGSGHRSNSLQPSPREGRDFWGKEGLPSSPTCHTCFLFFFPPPFQLRPMAFPALAAAKGSWHTHTWWALHV